MPENPQNSLIDVILCPAPFALAELRHSLDAEAGVELRPVQMDATAGMELDLADLERERRRVEEDEVVGHSLKIYFEY
jgi:hypothetical protein